LCAYTSSLKYLGFIVDEQLHWNNHIDYIAQLIRRLFFKRKSLKYILNINNLDFALTQSLLPYAVVVGGGMNTTELYKLEVVVNSSIKIILNRDRFYSTVQLYNDFHVLYID